MLFFGLLFWHFHHFRRRNKTVFVSLLTSSIDQHTAGHDALASLADRGNEALFAVHGKYYEAGCIPCVLYTASGTSLDWALGVAGIPYVYR